MLKTTSTLTATYLRAQNEASSEFCFMVDTYVSSYLNRTNTRIKGDRVVFYAAFLHGILNKVSIPCVLTI